LWPGVSIKFVSRVFKGREAIENGVEIKWAGNCVQKSGEPTVEMRVVNKGVEKRNVGIRYIPPRGRAEVRSSSGRAGT